MKVCLTGGCIMKEMRRFIPYSVFIRFSFFVLHLYHTVWCVAFFFAVSARCGLSRPQQSQWANWTWAVNVKALVALPKTLYIAVNDDVVNTHYVECVSIGGRVKTATLDKINLTITAFVSNCLKSSPCFSVTAASTQSSTLRRGLTCASKKSWCVVTSMTRTAIGLLKRSPGFRSLSNRSISFWTFSIWTGSVLGQAE